MSKTIIVTLILDGKEMALVPFKLEDDNSVSHGPGMRTRGLYKMRLSTSSVQVNGIHVEVEDNP
jgi:hypothetical protein